MNLLIANPTASVATLATPIRTKENLEDPACVKVVCGHDGSALYFSRSVIPHPRQWDPSMLDRDPPLFLQHIGIYAYRRTFLMRLHSLLPVTQSKLRSSNSFGFCRLGTGLLLVLWNLRTAESTLWPITWRSRPDGKKKPQENASSWAL